MPSGKPRVLLTVERKVLQALERAARAERLPPSTLARLMVERELERRGLLELAAEAEAEAE